MPSLEKYFQSSVLLQNMSDPLMAELIKEYIIKRHSDVFDTKPHRVYSDNTTLCQLLSDIHYSNLNYFVMNDSDKWDVLNYRKAFARFLLYLCETEYGKCLGSNIHRITDFVANIESGTVVEGLLPYLFHDDRYDEFRQSAVFAQTNYRRKTEVYLTDLDSSAYVDNRIFKICRDELFRIKYSDKYTAGTISGKIHYFKTACDSLALYKVSDLSGLLYVDILNSIPKKPQSAYFELQNSYIRLFEAFYQSGLINDANLNTYYEKCKEAPMSIDTAKKMLASIDVVNWENCYYPHGNEIRQAWRHVVCSEPEKRNLLLSFLHEYSLSYRWDSLNTFCEQFDSSLESPTCRLDFSSFCHQIHYFAEKQDDKSIYGVITAFYHYVYRTFDPDMFGKSNSIISAFHRQRIGYEVAEGYDIVPYNPIEPVPASDKWILCYKEHVHSDVMESKLLDFTDIPCLVYKNWIKEFIWRENVMVETKAHPLGVYKAAFDYIYGLKTGRIHSFLTKPTKELTTITVAEIEAYKNHILSTFDNNRTRNSKIYNFRNIIRFIADNNLGEIEAGVFYNLTYTLSSDYDNTEAIPDDELLKISNVMKDKAGDDITAAMFYAVFYIALETEFRGAQIVNLRRDCVKETAKRNEYVLVSGTKTSAGEIVEQPITTYVKREIDEIRKLGECYREECTNPRLKDRLFLIPSGRKKLYKQMTTARFNTFLQRCCNEADTKLYTIENLRDTHMTKADEYIIRKNLSEIEQSVLSGHKSLTTDTIHYVDSDIRTMLEAVHGVIIGNVSTDGQILPSVDQSISTAENEVSNGCGFCKSPVCENFTYLDCMLCKDFVTTIDRMPYFEEQIRCIDSKIAECTINHDKEDLINIKLLLLHYVEEILKLKGGDNDGRN